jgi:glycosyltransferase involved in cell wall biosynthesis
MKIWLVQTGEEMPSDQGQPRLLRTALLAKELALRGHDVLYWNATFNHQKKFQRASKTFRVRQGGLYDCIFLAGKPYQRNVSVARIISHIQNANAFSRLAPTEHRPDVIVCGFPTIELTVAVARFAKTWNIPLIVDARDMWPEVIEHYLPAPLRFAAAPILKFWTRQRNYALASAASIVGVSSGFVHWACMAAGRSVSAHDRHFFLAGDMSGQETKSMAAAHEFWDAQLGPIDARRSTVMMAGNLSSRVDILTAVRAAALLPQSPQLSFQLVVCGKGDLEKDISAIAGHSKAVFFAGWRSGAELQALAQRCSAGILAYSNTPDLSVSMPNKIGEYLSYGLPIITCLRGEIDRQLSKHSVIISYDEGSVASAIMAYQFATQQGKVNRASAVKAAYRELFDPATIYPKFANHVESFARENSGAT